MKYYDPKNSGIRMLFSWSATVFEMVFKRREFYLYIWWNIFLTGAFIHAVPERKVEDFNWDAAYIMQYVMTFFVTFYNDMCFSRYDKLYPNVCNFAEGVIDMAQELTLNLHWPDLTAHRIAAVKYLLAIVYEHFMMVCGGRLRAENWVELVNKGLLTQQEVDLLSKFPGGRVSSVLYSWVLFIIRDALVQDCMWRKNSQSSDVSQATVHIYNRFVKHVNKMTKCCNNIGYTLANPIPFAYYHLMNFILLFNIMLLATFSALYKSYASVFPFGIALLIYLGLREVSTALADPFGQDPVDFNIPDILRNCFDRALCILLAFQRQDTRDYVLKQIANVEDFDERHLRRACKPSVFAEIPGVPNKGPPACHSRWTPDSLFEDSPLDMDLKRRMKFSLNPKGPPPEIQTRDDLADAEERRQEAAAAAKVEEDRGDRLKLRKEDLVFEYSRLHLLLQELEFKFPQLLEYPAEGEKGHQHHHLQGFDEDDDDDDSEIGEVEVIIVSAKGLRNADIFGKSDPFCVCSVYRRPDIPEIETEVIEGNLAPEWDHQGHMHGCRYDDILEFSVFDKDVNSNELMGFASLEPFADYHESKGFSGSLHLEDDAGRAAGFLKVKVHMKSMAEQKETELLEAEAEKQAEEDAKMKSAEDEAQKAKLLNAQQTEASLRAKNKRLVKEETGASALTSNESTDPELRP